MTINFTFIGSPVFGVGHATTAMTTGIWATCVRHPEFEDQVLMLLDTEGLGDIKKVHLI